jgi:hypothetical protein
MNDSVLECLRTAIDAVNFGSSDVSKLNLYASLNNCEEFMEILEDESKKDYSTLFENYKDLAKDVFCIKLAKSLDKVHEYGGRIVKVRIKSNLFWRLDMYQGNESGFEFSCRIIDVMSLLMKGLPDHEQGDKLNHWWEISIYCTNGVDIDSLSSNEHKYVFSV